MFIVYKDRNQIAFSYFSICQKTQNSKRKNVKSKILKIRPTQFLKIEQAIFSIY